MVHSHQNGKAEESLELLHSDRCPRLILLVAMAYLLLSLTISSCRSSEKKSSNTLIGDSGMSVVGPTVDVKLSIVTDCSWSVHELGDVPVITIMKHG